MERKMTKDKINFNISAIIGNGFDIKILKGLGFKNDRLPTFVNFYIWLEKRHFDPTNLLLQEINKRKSAEDDIKSWTDLEDIIADLINSEQANEQSTIFRDIGIIKQQFTLFLNEIITSSDIIDIAQKYDQKKLGKATIESFYREITSRDKEGLKGLGEVWVKHYVHYHWHFLNLNYTTVLDNYFQFELDPHPFQYSDNNLTINSGEPSIGVSGPWTPQVKLSTSFYHPHGVQDVPGSMLLGTAGEKLEDGNGSNRTSKKDSDAWKYNKPYIGRLEEKYGYIIDNTNLFIIFGSSLGESDRYWWSSVIDKVISEDAAELIIYWYNIEGVTEADIINKIYKFGNNTDREVLREIFESRTRVILYSDQENERLQYGFLENDFPS